MEHGKSNIVEFVTFDTQSWSNCSPAGRARQNGANLFLVSIQCIKEIGKQFRLDICCVVCFYDIWSMLLHQPITQFTYLKLTLDSMADLPPNDDDCSLDDLFAPVPVPRGKKRKATAPKKGKKPLVIQSESNSNSMPSRAGAPSSGSTTVAAIIPNELPPPDDDGEIDFIRSGTLSRPHVLPKAKISPRSQACRTKGGPKGSTTNVGGKSKEPRKTKGVPGDLFEWTSETLKGAAEEIPSVVAMPFLDMVDVMNAPWSRSWWNERCTLWEIYSVPRLGPHVRKLGGTCRRSYDIQHFWNLGLESYQRTLLQDLATFRPFYLSLSPPCTYLCKLMASNWSRMRGNQKFLCLRDGLGHVDLCAWLALYQLRTGAFFGMEHPAGSLAWKRLSAAQFERIIWSPYSLLDRFHVGKNSHHRCHGILGWVSRFLVLGGYGLDTSFEHLIVKPN